MGRPGGNPDIRKHSFKKGDPRINRKGGPKKLPRLETILAHVIGYDADSEEEEDAKAVKIITQLYKQALKGNVRAAELLLERGYGRAKQQDAGNAAPPITFNIVKTYENPKKK